MKWCLLLGDILTACGVISIGVVAPFIVAHYHVRGIENRRKQNQFMEKLESS